ncbi:MAG: TldD/PmbA family protein [Candidatus Eisenbacteria bacterium]
MTPTEALRSSAEALLELARRSGADEAQVTAAWSREIKVGFERNELSLSSSGEESSLRLRVHHGHRLGSASTNSIAHVDLVRAVEAAMAVAALSPPDEYLNMPAPERLEARPLTWDDAVDALHSADLRALAEEYLRVLRGDPRISIDSGNVSSDAGHAILLNSHGVDVSESWTKLSWLGSGQGIDGDDITNFDYGGGMSWQLAGARERMLADGARMATQLASTFGAAPGESYKGAVLLTPKSLEELLLDAIEFHLSGLQVFYGKSVFTDDRLGTAVANPRFTLVDDPSDAGLSGCTAWDSEGVPTSRRTFIDSGRLCLQMENAYSARRRGRPRTGHCGFGLHGAKVSPGDGVLAEMLRPSHPLLAVHRFSGNVDAASGDFSGVAKGSHLYLPGGERRPVSETMISGNVFELLESIVSMSREVEVVENGYSAPWILVDGVSVTAEE